MNTRPTLPHWKRRGRIPPVDLKSASSLVHAIVHHSVQLPRELVSDWLLRLWHNWVLHDRWHWLRQTLDWTRISWLELREDRDLLHEHRLNLGLDLGVSV